MLQTNIVGISKFEAEQFLGCPVEEVGLDYIAKLRSQIIISNDASVGWLLDESNFSIFIAHGNVGMPLRDVYYCSGWTSYWDAIVSSSRSLFDLIKTGLHLFRQDRGALRLEPEEGRARTDLRNTSAVSVLPVKIPEAFSAPPEFRCTSEEYVVGLLPTQIGICPSGASLFENMEVVVNSVKSQIPQAKIIFRPYMTDFEHPYVKELCEQLARYPWISIDDTRGSSKDFYRICDTIITDASSGGVSFMLNTCKLPIYYVPTVHGSNPIVEAWLDQMEGLLPIAKSGDELKDMLLGFKLLTPEQKYFIYKKFYDSEYSELHHPDEVFLDLVQQQHETCFRYCLVDSLGGAHGKLINNPASLAQ
ncbi:hypothetical protein [Pseudomonas sp. O230]|uniref:hypothetical protein n=1 Tax=Pseudomonas sp. O230 TaxID=3159450 RepID=UPI00387B214D